MRNFQNRLGLFELVSAIRALQRQVEIQQGEIEAVESRISEFDVRGEEVKG